MTNLWKIRKKRRLSQVKLQIETGIDQSLISKIEKGEREASTDVLKKLAELFGCKVSAIINEEEDISCLNVAFRTNGMSEDDLNSIAVINRIALNLENMQQMLKG